jgi:hypothetical protein
LHAQDGGERFRSSIGAARMSGTTSEARVRPAPGADAMHIATVAPSAAANRLAPIRSFLIDSAPGAGFSSPDFQIFFWFGRRHRS